MSNFTFLPKRFSEIAVAVMKAEGHINSDPRAACFHARFALEAALHWLYRFEGRLKRLLKSLPWGRMDRIYLERR